MENFGIFGELNHQTTPTNNILNLSVNQYNQRFKHEKFIMSPTAYSHHLLEILISRFRKECYDKTGIIPVVVYDIDIKSGVLSLQELEDICNQYIPQYLRIQFPTITDPIQKRDIVDLRHIFCYIAVKDFEYTYVDVGQYLGGKDHTTILSSLRRFDKLIDKNADFYSLYHRIKDQVTKALQTDEPDKSILIESLAHE